MFDIDFENAIMAVGSHYGIYTPQVFMERFGDNINHDIKDMADILADLSDPYNEHYWEAWETIIDNCTVTIDGNQYSIYTEDDVWLIPIN